LEFQRIKIPYPAVGTLVNIEPLSDIHVGGIFHDKKKFEERRNRIRDDPTCFTILMGDLFDCTDPDNKFFDMKTRDPELPDLEDQFQYLLKMLLPIRHKILGVLTGNHDERQRKRHYDDVVLRLTNALNAYYPPEFNVPDLNSAGLVRLIEDTEVPYTIKYLRYLGITRLVFYRKFADSGKEHIDSSWDIFTAHGGYSGQLVGGNINALEKIAMLFSADVYLTGHTHNAVAYKMEKVAMDSRGHLQKIVKIFGSCGSFAQPYMEGVHTYPEVKILAASRVGTITISIDPYNRKLQAHE